MPINHRPIKRLAALVFTGVTAMAVAAPTVAGAYGTQTSAHRSAVQQMGSGAPNRGNPNAVPPILRPASRSELKAMRAAEVFEGQEFYYRPPAGAVYDSAVFNAFAIEGQGGS
jgi:hypothetical protein